jgi:glycosyltransferase involved in cell wall biosynthesis
VHARIVDCFTPERPWVIFTKRSDNDSFRPLFRGGRTFNLWLFCKYGYPFSVGILAGIINRHRRATVFGSNSLVYYLLLPYLRPHVRAVDLLHAFGAGIEEYSLPMDYRLQTRVVICDAVRRQLEEQYRDKGCDAALLERILVIPNAVAVPEEPPARLVRARLSIVYVGRGSAEKRVHLVGRIAARCARESIAADFLLVGEVDQAVAPADRPFCSFAGEVRDDAAMSRIYDTADLLLLTSSREGFPLVIMEAMARGVVPIATAVGGIGDQLHDGVSGWLVSDAANEEQLVDDFCAHIRRMAANRQLLAAMSQAAYRQARNAFSEEGFCAAWRELLLGVGRGGE